MGIRDDREIDASDEPELDADGTEGEVNHV